ncbi:hypothetical protein EV697_10588 [Bisgaardia hudsonensis]|uniref:DUF484 family protein n=1 Tax=Bisgaardia hudsonensis TaxID=109472 RepID=A0A4R2MXJ7_9PAST|nr:DUF484 family protein [Bisgaardia hudsonensis]QLB13644.1 hypothetical protein A6A11_08500 [Bisgaardia hudsonensis]TCP11976.1 hypothetical protein EV697_10588 [Bisgaardia hudsonensis]
MDKENIKQQVVQFLQSHPDFFKNHLDLLDCLIVPHNQSGTISLIEMQLARQREKIQQLEKSLQLFAQLANQQQDIFFALMPLQQKLSQCNTLTDGITTINQWAKEWELQQAKILLFTNKWHKHNELLEDYWLDPKAFEIIRLERFGLRRFYLGNMTNKEKSLLFLANEFPIGSVACCLLGTKTSQNATALLIFSSRDTQHFHNGQDTKFLKHLVDIVELHLSRWLSNHWDNMQCNNY